MVRASYAKRELPNYQVFDERRYFTPGGWLRARILGDSPLTNEKVDANREFLGQGVANLAGSFLQCYPASGSFTRSAINRASGAKTRIAAALSGVFLVVIVLGSSSMFFE